MRWKIQELTVGWPPSVTLVRGTSDVDALHPLFTYLAGRRLLLFGYGRSSGIDDPQELSRRIDDLRNELFRAMSALAPRAAVGSWLRKLELACHELLGKVYEELHSEEPASTEADIVQAVNEMRDAFLLLAERVAQVYNLPAAEALRDGIAKDRKEANEG